MEIKKNMSSWQLCDEIAKALKADKRFQSEMSVAQYGPFGIRAYSSVYLIDQDDETIVAYITVETDGDGWYEYETNERKELYPEGSIGALNGMNKVLAPLPHDMTEVVDLAYALATYNVVFNCDLTLDNGTKYSFRRAGYKDIDEAKSCFQTALTDFFKKRGCPAGATFSMHVTYEDKDGNYLESDDGEGIIGEKEVQVNVV